jgi:hypothetical protein
MLAGRSIRRATPIMACRPDTAIGKSHSMRFLSPDTVTARFDEVQPILSADPRATADNPITVSRITPLIVDGGWIGTPGEYSENSAGLGRLVVVMVRQCESRHLRQELAPWPHHRRVCGTTPRRGSASPRARTANSRRRKAIRGQALAERRHVPDLFRPWEAGQGFNGVEASAEIRRQVGNLSYGARPPTDAIAASPLARARPRTVG